MGPGKERQIKQVSTGIAEVGLSIKAVTFYDVSGSKAEPLAVFRFVKGKIEAESLVPGSIFIDMWLEGTWDLDEERMISPDEGERYLRALIERPMTYFRFEPGEPDHAIRLEPEQ